MTIGRTKRESNQLDALRLMLRELGFGSIQVTFFDATATPFSDAIFRTTWAELESQGYVLRTGESRYRLSARGWLVALEADGIGQEFRDQYGRIVGALKRHVKGRTADAVATLSDIANASGEPKGLIFNIIDSRATTSLNSGRVGAIWVENERGVLIDIPVNFGSEPLDITAALSAVHLAKIEELEEALRVANKDWARRHCPDCDSEIVQMGDVDHAEDHCIVSYETYACGLVLADGFEESPCHYGPRWPKIEEFDFVTTPSGRGFRCTVVGKTERAKRIHLPVAYGKTKEEAELIARDQAVPIKEG
jgi:hypothetical protein